MKSKAKDDVDDIVEEAEEESVEDFQEATDDE